MSKQKQIGHLLKRAVLRQLADRVTSIEETGFSFIDEAKRRFSGDHPFETRAISRTVFHLCRGRLVHDCVHRSSPFNAREHWYIEANCTILVASSCGGAGPSVTRTAS